MSMGKSEIEFRNVTKIFNEETEKEVYAVRNVSMLIEDSQLVSFLGPSGCGKTTSLRMVAGFEHPTSGDLYLWGKRANDLPPQKRGVSMVFQSYGLFPHMTVAQNISYGLKVKRLSRRDIKKKLSWALELVELQGLEDRSTGQLSGGQQQRVALCRAIVTEPRALLFDEPLSNLDAKLRRGTREHLRNLQQELGITSIYVTHDQTEAMSISDKIIIMNEGEIQQVGKPQEIYNRPANRFVADFIGEANFLSAVVSAINGDQITIRLFDKEISFSQENAQCSIGEEMNVVVRPEAVDLVDVGLGDVDASVLFSHYTGSVVLYALSLPNGERVEVQVANPQERGLLPVGVQTGLRLHRRSLQLLRREY
jgi:iron(III) transport system ATP-binding protein